MEWNNKIKTSKTDIMRRRKNESTFVCYGCVCMCFGWFLCITLKSCSMHSNFIVIQTYWSRIVCCCWTNSNIHSDHSSWSHKHTHTHTYIQNTANWSDQLHTIWICILNYFTHCLDKWNAINTFQSVYHWVSILIKTKQSKANTKMKSQIKSQILEIGK